MKVIKAPNTARAHELAVEYVAKEGRRVYTEDGEATTEADELCLEISTPLSEPRVSEKSSFKSMFAEAYAQNLLTGYASEVKFEYDYHDRLFHYGGGRDQVAYIVDKLRRARVSRRAVATTWAPYRDSITKDVPCLQLIQCVVRAGKLEMKVVFRSNDMLSAAGMNMYALVALQEDIAQRVGVPVGKYTHIALVPHIYDMRDADELRRFV